MHVNEQSTGAAKTSVVRQDKEREDERWRKWAQACPHPHPLHTFILYTRAYLRVETSHIPL